MGTIILFLMLLISPAYAGCPVNAGNDSTYAEGNVVYGCPSKATLQTRADAQAVIEAQKAVEKEKADKQAQLDELDKQSVRALRAQLVKSCDSKDADCQVLQAKENQAKALRGQ